jgi:hypothetical protein
VYNTNNSGGTKLKRNYIWGYENKKKKVNAAGAQGRMTLKLDDFGHRRQGGSYVVYPPSGAEGTLRVLVVCNHVMVCC